MITAEIVTMEEQPGLQNILIFVQFKRDGKELTLAWNKDGTPIVRDGKRVWPLVSRMENYLAKTAAERKFWIDVNIEHMMKNVVRAEAAPAVNQGLISDLGILAGTKYSLDTTDIDIEINNTGETRTVNLRDDGTVTVK